MYSGKSVTEYTPFTLELEYRDTDRIPTYIVVVASASKYGDYFTGGDGSVLFLDDFTLEYDYWSAISGESKSRKREKPYLTLRPYSEADDRKSRMIFADKAIRLLLANKNPTTFAPALSRNITGSFRKRI